MKPVEEIKYPIQKEMERFEEKFKDSMLSKVPLLNRITYYIVRRKGKQMRPMFVFLIAKMVSDGGFDQRTYRGASIVELIHTASLVHDDIVDDSNRRRGFFSINALWKNKIAVLVGDFLFSMVNYARFLNIEPDSALEKANQKFTKRLLFIENVTKEKGKSINELNHSELDSLWLEAKNYDSLEDKSS